MGEMRGAEDVDADDAAGTEDTRASDPVVLITPAERREADPTSGMAREQAISVDGLWAGLVRTEAHAASGWHHHGDYDTAIFVVDGDVRLEFGADGAQVVDAKPGDFLYVPRGAVHRESNPSKEQSHIVVVRAGSGPPTVNVAGPSSVRRRVPPGDARSPGPPNGAQ